MEITNKEALEMVVKAANLWYESLLKNNYDSAAKELDIALAVIEREMMYGRL